MTTTIDLDLSAQENNLTMFSADNNLIIALHGKSIFDKLGDKLGDTFWKADESIFNTNQGFLQIIFPKSPSTFDTSLPVHTDDSMGVSNLEAALGSLILLMEKELEGKKQYLLQMGTKKLLHVNRI